MSFKIEPGQNYLLDGKTVVKALKSVNRSLAIFNVEAHWLKPLKEVQVSSKPINGFRFLEQVVFSMR